MVDPPPPKRVKVAAAAAVSKAVGSDLVTSFLGPLLPTPVPFGVVEMFLLYVGLAGQAALVVTSKHTLSVVNAVRAAGGYPQRTLRALFPELNHHKFPADPEGDARALRLLKQRIFQRFVARLDRPEFVPVSIPPLESYGALIDVRGAEGDSSIKVSSYIPSASIRFDNEVPGNILIDFDALEDEWNRSVILPLAKNDNLWITLHFHLVGTDQYLLVFSGQYHASCIRSFSEHTSLDVWESLGSHVFSKQCADIAILEEKRNGNRPTSPIQLKAWSSLDFIRSRCCICTCSEGRETLRQIGSVHEHHYNDYELNNFIPLDHDDVLHPDHFLFLPKICKCCKCGYVCHRLQLRLTFRDIDGEDVDTRVGALWMLRKLAMKYKRDGSGCKL